jgi:hypothetical protein
VHSGEGGKARAREYRPVLKPAFLFLAVLGSVLTCYGTMGRQALGNDSREQEAKRQNRTLATKLEELQEAKAGAKAECIKAGDRCKWWTG